MAAKINSFSKLLPAISLILLVLLDASKADENVKRLDNVFCGTPSETVVAVDSGNHHYFPYFVKLHRCSGSYSSFSPSQRRCVPSSYKELKIQVYSLLEDYKATTITVKNHTQCTDECVNTIDNCDLSLEYWNEDECECKCMYPNGPPKELACKEGFRWNRHTCSCECARAPEHCPSRMTWSNDICGCKCQDRVITECTQGKMGIDSDCNCVNVLAISDRIEADPHYRMFITLLIGQAVLIIILICTLVHWVRKRTRQNSAHSLLDRSDSNKTDDDIEQQYMEVAMESGPTHSLEDLKYSSSDDVSCTAPLSPKHKETDI